MIADALKWIADHALAAGDVQQLEIDGQKFTDRALVRVPNEPVPEPVPVTLSTLRSLTAYMDADPDTMVADTFLSVISPTEVRAISPTLGGDETRKTYATCTASLPTHRFGRYMPVVEMGIYVRTCFVPTELRDELVAFLGLVVEGSEVETKDDGVTQKTTIRHGISFRAEGEVPGLVTLAPYRTFHDVKQPRSDFVLRVENQGGQVVAALFEADGGAWQHEAMQSVALYLHDELVNQALEVFA